MFVFIVCHACVVFVEWMLLLSGCLLLLVILCYACVCCLVCMSCQPVNVGVFGRCLFGVGFFV